MKDFVLTKVMSWLIGGEFFQSVRDIVAGLARTDIPGSEKREIALKRVSALAGTTATFVLNLAIEAAVYLLKLQTEKK